MGVIETAPDGQLSFVPNYVLPKGSNEAQGQPSAVALLTFRPGQRVFVDATADELREQYLEPFAPEEVVALAGREGVVVGYAGCASLELVVVMIDGVPWAFMPAYLAHVQSAEGDEGQAAVTDEGVATAFDPYREPLAVGDTVQGMDGRVGCVTLAERRRLAVVFEHGSAWCGDLVWRCLFQLIRKAGERRRDGCPS
ncbi:hypothetical protein [Azohydromonas australica]|uniref:hypothetical protein n=1 Tax=Azohydromonas australica TaxID=364039 RepID=UPI00048CC2EC|nr:hypothetical protein [Azohydromonas australica]